MRALHSYIVRVYRRDAQAMAGLLEDVQRRRSAPFRSLAELCEMLGGRKPVARRPPARSNPDEGDPT